MVRYNGRQRLLTSVLNTNQIGLNMSGASSSVGSSISNRRYTKRRVRDNLKFCGPVYYHGQLWSNNSGNSCVKKAPINQGLSGGVGRINNPRTKCNIKCSSPDYDSMSTGITFIARTLKILSDDGDVETIVGYASANLLTVESNKGSITATDAAADGEWILTNNDQSVVWLYVAKDEEDASRIKNITPTLNDIKGILAAPQTGKVFIYNFNTLLIKDNTYTLSF